MVKVLKSRFELMYKKRGYSERKLGLELETHSHAEGGITYRSLQRCLQNGEMKFETIELCSKILQCETDYLRGLTDFYEGIVPSSVKDKENYLAGIGMSMDSDGNMFRTYDQEQEDKKFPRSLGVFTEFLRKNISDLWFDTFDENGKHHTHSGEEYLLQSRRFEYVLDRMAYGEGLPRRLELPSTIDWDSLNLTDDYLAFLGFYRRYMAERYSKRKNALDHLNKMEHSEQIDCLREAVEGSSLEYLVDEIEKRG